MNNIENQFQPDYTPYEVIKNGSFGSTYFRPIYSQVTGKKYKDADLEFDWGDISRDKLIKPWNQYDVNSNKYKVKVGTTLEFWESKGWVHPQDPYGWFQWYCRYYAGRRTADDIRQIKRWIGIKNRFSKIKNKSPAVKQTLLHWGIKAD
jgi:hypothetical protein